jgi:hypothetical protein
VCSGQLANERRRLDDRQQHVGIDGRVDRHLFLDGLCWLLGTSVQKSEIYASTTSLVSYIVFKKMYLLGKVRAGEFTFDKYAFVYFD